MYWVQHRQLYKLAVQHEKKLYRISFCLNGIYTNVEDASTGGKNGRFTGVLLSHISSDTSISDSLSLFLFRRTSVNFLPPSLSVWVFWSSIFSGIPSIMTNSLSCDCLLEDCLLGRQLIHVGGDYFNDVNVNKRKMATTGSIMSR